MENVLYVMVIQLLNVVVVRHPRYTFVILYNCSNLLILSDALMQVDCEWKDKHFPLLVNGLPLLFSLSTDSKRLGNVFEYTIGRLVTVS
jgi:hypothetical protein